MPKLYTLLGLIPSTAERFTFLHLKDAFCLQLAPVSQPLFAPEWENPHEKQGTALLDEASSGFQELPYSVQVELWPLT